MLKRISTQQLFMALSKDEVSLNINNKDNLAVTSIVNLPKYESTYCPIIAAIMHIEVLNRFLN